MKGQISVVLFMLFALPVPADPAGRSDNSPFYLGGGLHYGFIIPHYMSSNEIADQSILGLQVSASKLLINQKAWSSCNCYSRMGLSFSFFDYRNPEVLGHSYNLIYFYEPYLNFKSRLRFSIRGGIGLSYLDRVYDEETNPENLFYSSAISGLLALTFNLNYLIRDNLQLNVGLNYSHISNGGMKMPNKGMNFPTLSAGIDYLFNPVNLNPQLKQPGLKSRPFHFYSRLFCSMRSVEADQHWDKAVKPMIGLEGGIIRGISNINGLLFGTELSYDGSYKEISARTENDFSPVVISLHAGHIFVLGKFSFTQQLAYYVHHDLPGADNSFFQRYGMFYNIGKLLSLGFSLKAHSHVAEHMDIRVGIEF